MLADKSVNPLKICNLGFSEKVKFFLKKINIGMYEQSHFFFSSLLSVVSVAAQNKQNRYL